MKTRLALILIVAAVLGFAVALQFAQQEYEDLLVGYPDRDGIVFDPSVR